MGGNVCAKGAKDSRVQDASVEGVPVGTVAKVVEEEEEFVGVKGGCDTLGFLGGGQLLDVGVLGSTLSY